MARIVQLIVFIFCSQLTWAQKDSQRSGFLRLYTDNDAFVPVNTSIDWGYTSGIRIDLYHSSNNLHGPIACIFKVKNERTINTAGWGLLQMIYTPKSIRPAIPDRNDYSYSGALVAVYSFHSANATKKINLSTESMIGLLGPPSLASPTHKFFHRLIGDPVPKGWGYQLPTDLLLNFNFELEKTLSNSNSLFLSGIAGAKIGTMNDGLTAGLDLSLHKNHFKGLSAEYFSSGKISIKSAIRLAANLELYNALLEGGLFNKNSPVHDKNSKSGSNLERERLSASSRIILLFALKKFAASWSLTGNTTDFKNYDGHWFGNISAYIRL